jgi:hypothetical protein
VQRKRDSDGILIGKASRNPILDTRSVVVSFQDGREADYSANVIAENTLAMCDDEGNQYLLMKHIIDHKKLQLSPRGMRTYEIGGGSTLRKAPKVGNFVSNGKMVPRPGNHCLC